MSPMCQLFTTKFIQAGLPHGRVAAVLLCWWKHCAERQIFSQDGSLAAYHMHKHFTVDVCAFRDVLF